MVVGELLSNVINDEIFTYHIIQIYSGITSGRVLDGELLYTKILEVNLFHLPTDYFMTISFQSMGRFSLRVWDSAEQ